MLVTASVAYLCLMLGAWGCSAYCTARCWTPGVRAAWDQKRRAQWTLPQSIPSPDVLGPVERVWYDRANRFGLIFLAMLLGPILISFLWSKLAAG